MSLHSRFVSERMFVTTVALVPLYALRRSAAASMASSTHSFTFKICEAGGKALVVPFA